MKKITILCLHLGYGGIERAISMLANNLCNDYEVNIVSTYKLYDKPKFELNYKIKIDYLINDKPNREEFKKNIKKFNIIGIIEEGIKSIKILYYKKRKMIEYIKKCNSDIIITTRDIHNKWLGKYGNADSLKIGWEHNHYHGNMKYANKVTNSVKNLDYFVLVSKELKDYYENRLRKYNCKCIYIPNAIEKIESEQSKLNSNNLISVGRLSSEKGYLDLIDVFKLIHENNSNLILHIFGDGIEYNQIINKINDYNLNNNIVMHGFQDQKVIANMLNESSLYIMCSYTESFGIVLLEAFSHGVPCIAFDSAEGAREIIDNEINGYLISGRSKEKMAKIVLELMSDLNKRKEMGKKALEKSKLFEIDIISEKWKKIIENVLK